MASPRARFHRRNAIVIALGVMLTYLGVRGVKGLENPYADFYDFFHAAVAFRAGADIYASGDHGYIYPPMLAFALQPLAAMGARAAGFAWLALSLAGLIGAVALSSRWWAGMLAPAERDWTRWLAPGVVALLVLLTTFKREFDWGNCNILIILAVIVSGAWVERRPVLAGLVLGFAFTIKYLPIVFLAYLLARRRWRAVGGMLAGIVGFALLPAIGSGWENNLRDLGMAYRGMASMLGMDVGGSAANVVPVEALYSMSWTSSSVRIALALGVDRAWGYALAGAGAIAFVAAAWGVYRSERRPFLAGVDAASPGGGLVLGLEWSGMVVAMLLFGPQTLLRHHNMLLPVVAGALALAMLARGGARRWSLAAGLMSLVLGAVHMPMPDLWRAGADAYRAYGGVAISVAIFSLLFLRCGLATARRLDGSAPVGCPGGDHPSGPGASSERRQETGIREPMQRAGG